MELPGGYFLHYVHNFIQFYPVKLPSRQLTRVCLHCTAYEMQAYGPKYMFYNSIFKAFQLDSSSCTPQHCQPKFFKIPDMGKKQKPLR